MSFYDDASLIVYPSGYKESKIYAQKPVNGTGDLTFTRASSATRVNAEGLIETPSVFGSEQVTNGDFATDSDWTKGAGWTISGGVASTVGTTKSPLSQNCLINGLNRLTFTLISGEVSVYTNYPSFGNRQNYTVAGTYTIDLPNTTNPTLYFYNKDAGTSCTIDNVSVKEVITSNIPRIDYTGGGCGSLLLEPQSTNLITQSSDFSGWNSGSTYTTANYGTSPDGTLNASRLLFTSSGQNIYINTTATGDVVGSLYVKGVSGETIQLYVSGAETLFTLNGSWQRIIVEKTSAANGFFNINTNGGATARDLLIYGAQVEAGSYATSYIPTSGTSTTRLADSASKTGLSSVINSTEGVLYAEISALSNDLTNRFMCLSDGSNDNRVLVGYRAISNQLFSRIEANNSASIDLTHVLTDSTEVIKFAIKYDSSFNYKMFLNGVLVDSGVGTDSIIGLNRIDFANATGTENFFGNCQNLMVFPSALTDDELADLTGAVHQTFNSLATFYNYTIL